jgi:diguanylate cyclase (GGDEF)-like protein
VVEVDRRGLPSRAVLAGYAVTVALALTAYATTRGVASDIVYTVVTVLPVIAIPLGVRLNGIRKRRVWYLLAGAISVLTVSNLLYAAGSIWGHWTAAEDQLFYWGYPVAYVGLLTASWLLVAQRAPRDSGGVIDAALVGICGGGMLWEWLLRPGLPADYSDPGTQVFVLVSTLALMATLGSLLRVAAAIGRARASLVFLFVSLSCTLIGNVTEELGYSGLKTELWIISYLSLGAAALHPAAARLTTATDDRPAPVTSRRLVRLGLILAVNPLVGGVPQLFGRQPDGLLLTLGTLVSIPLVLIRVGQLARQRTEAQQALAYQAAHDELTGLPNRRTVLDQLDRAVEQVHAGELTRLTVLFCDLDGFKPINDRLGHQVGDEVLRIAALRLRDCVRTGDLVGRFGGDEFLIVCRGDGGDDVASRVERAFDDPLVVSKGTVRLGVSVGVAGTTPGAATTADALVALADDEMYVVKRARHRAAS